MPPLKMPIRCKKSPVVSSESMIKVEVVLENSVVGDVNKVINECGEPDAGGDKVTEDLPLKIDDLQHGSENVDQNKQGSGINGPQLETVADEMAFISEDGEPQIQTDEMGPNEKGKRWKKESTETNWEIEKRRSKENMIGDVAANSPSNTADETAENQQQEKP
ncbi:unnamed protein product [Lactuca saligna]|uniref:Uncharacterized protein n=1 Tax=Lactuca saligna TaxID=75948 RepID=A0AA35YTD8_LACSI|nr:unnamed protein product [Lactuca saligna]